MCGFAWDAVGVEEIGPRLDRAAAELAALLRADEAQATQRPSEIVWSATEYAAHVRDVLLHVRDRLVIALVEDDPSFKPLYRDQRVDLGLYAADVPAVVADELLSAAGLFRRTVERLTAEQLARTAEYAYPVTATRTVRWMAAQALHEAEHHLGDARDAHAQA